MPFFDIWIVTQVIQIMNFIQQREGEGSIQVNRLIFINGRNDVRRLLFQAGRN